MSGCQILMAMTFLTGTLGFAKTRKAHVHGSAELNLVVAEKSGDVELRAPAMSVFGFEHKPRTDADRKTVERVTRDIRSRIDELVQFPKSARCVAKNVEVKAFVELGGHGTSHAPHRGAPKAKRHHDHEDREHGETQKHSEVHISYQLACAEDLSGAIAKFGVTKVLPKVKTVRVKALGDSIQKGLTLKNDRGSIRF